MKREILPNSFVPTDEQDLASCKAAIINYAKKACLTNDEIGDLFKKLDNLELAPEPFVRYWMPGKAFEGDRDRFIAALSQYQSLQKNILRAEFLGGL